MLTGKVGAEVSVEEAYQRARLIGLQLLSATRTALGSLDRVDAVLKMLVMVNAVPEFKDHPKVANGMSDLFVEVLGDAGKHARSAVGMGSLPNQISVEIEGVIAIKP
jgi:enamine deaminase RidA (YjgF/YER057c/UK114 family)